MKHVSADGDFTARLRGIVFTSQTTLCLRFDIKRVGLGPVGGYGRGLPEVRPGDRAEVRK